ncbi:MAG TPA: hypothetical protein VFZ16_11120 [Hyphomicrobiaceae bacterium]|nr:hypothetical protein [Hyphomicrobiaceae bacterium]
MENEEHAEHLQSTITSRPIISNSVVPTIVDFTGALLDREGEADDEHRTVNTKKSDRC